MTTTTITLTGPFLGAPNHKNVAFLQHNQAHNIFSIVGFAVCGYNCFLKRKTMQKIVINACYGGFGLTDEAMDLYTKLCESAGVEAKEYVYEISRDCPHLVETVLTLGTTAKTRCYSKLKIVEIPDGVEWSVHEYDGMEWVAENHRTWS
jgi:hypothetical protein